MANSTHANPTPVQRRFGCYVLPGRIKDSRRGIAEAQDAEEVGLGTAWLSERFALKDAPSLCGAMAQATSHIGIGGTTYFHNRHPLTTVSFMSTMQAISGGRFSLIFARGHEWLHKAMGVPHTTFPVMRDMRDILLKLMSGETVRYNGPAGDYPELKVVDRYEGPCPPMILTAMGPKTLAFAGRHFDGVLLHPMITVDAVARSARIVKESAAAAGRDPDTVKVLANIIVAPDLPTDLEEALVGGRAVTYLHPKGYGETIVNINGWDTAGLEKLRALPIFAKLGREHADQSFTAADLAEASRALPQEWFAKAAAVGTAAECAAKLADFVAAGADEVVLHATPPSKMGNLIAELNKVIS